MRSQIAGDSASRSAALQVSSFTRSELISHTSRHRNALLLLFPRKHNSRSCSVHTTHNLQLSHVKWDGNDTFFFPQPLSLRVALETFFAMLSTFHSHKNLFFSPLLFFFRLLQCDAAPILYMLGKNKRVSLNNAKLFLGIIDRKIAQMINNVQSIEPSTKILGKKDRVPAFNVKESVKGAK